MSVRFDTDSNDVLFSTTNLLSSVNMTVCFWIKFVTAGAGFIRQMWSLQNSGNSVNNSLIWTAANAAQMSSGANAVSLSGTPTIGDWLFMAYTATTAGAGSAIAYWRDNVDVALASAVSVTGSSFTPAILSLGQVAQNVAAAAELANYMEFDSVLTATQLLAQSKTITPITAGGLTLRRNIAMLNAATAGNDTSGNGFNLTISGTLTDGASSPTFPAAAGAAAQNYYRMWM